MGQGKTLTVAKLCLSVYGPNENSAVYKASADDHSSDWLDGYGEPLLVLMNTT